MISTNPGGRKSSRTDDVSGDCDAKRPGAHLRPFCPGERALVHLGEGAAEHDEVLWLALAPLLHETPG
jgi:hypothetical protein